MLWQPRRIVNQIRARRDNLSNRLYSGLPERLLAQVTACVERGLRAIPAERCLHLVSLGPVGLSKPQPFITALSQNVFRLRRRLAELGVMDAENDKRDCRSRISRSSQNWTFLALCFVVLAMGRTAAS